LDWDQFVPDIVQLHEPGINRTVFEVERCCLKDIGTKFFPRFRLGEDAMAKCPGAIAAFLSVANCRGKVRSS